MNKLSTYGMPSTRAASLFFIIVYIYLTNRELNKNTIFILILCVIIACGLKFIRKGAFIYSIIGWRIIGSFNSKYNI